VDLVGAIHNIEDRFMDESDKQMCLLILKSLAKGQTINVSKVGGTVPSKKSEAKDSGVLITPNDKDQIKQIHELLAG